MSVLVAEIGLKTQKPSERERPSKYIDRDRGPCHNYTYKAGGLHIRRTYETLQHTYAEDIYGTPMSISPFPSPPTLLMVGISTIVRKKKDNLQVLVMLLEYWDIDSRQKLLDE